MRPSFARVRMGKDGARARARGAKLVVWREKEYTGAPVGPPALDGRKLFPTVESGFSPERAGLS